MNQGNRRFHAFAAVWFSWFEKSSGKARPQGADRALQTGVLASARAFAANTSYARAFSHVDGKAHADQLVCVVNLRISVDHGLKVAVALKELVQCLFCDGD